MMKVLSRWWLQLAVSSTGSRWWGIEGFSNVQGKGGGRPGSGEEGWTVTHYLFHWLMLTCPQGGPTR